MKVRLGILFLAMIMALSTLGQSGSSCCEPINLTQEKLTLQVDSGSVWFYALSSLMDYDITFRPTTWKTITDSSEVKSRRILINFLVVCNCEDGPHYDSVYIHYWPEEEIEELMEKDNEYASSYNTYISSLRYADSLLLDSLSEMELSALTAADIFYQTQNFGLEDRRQADLSGALNEANGFIEMVFPTSGTLTLINRSENITCQQNTIFLTYNDTAKAAEGQLYRMCPIRDITPEGINIIYHGTAEANVYMYRNCKRDLFEAEGMIHNVSENGYWLTLQPNSGTETLLSIRDFITIYNQYRQFFFEVNSTDPNAYFQVVNYQKSPTEDNALVETQQNITPLKIIENGHIIIRMPNGVEYDLIGRRIR